MSLKDEIKRLETLKEKQISVDRADYISMLKELKVLRFKVNSRVVYRAAPMGEGLKPVQPAK